MSGVSNQQPIDSPIGKPYEQPIDQNIDRPPSLAAEQVPLPFEELGEKKFLDYSDTLLRLIKHYKTQEVIRGRPVLNHGYQNTGLQMHEYLDAISADEVGGTQPRELWDYFSTLLEQREDGHYYLNRQALNVYHALCERLWEDLDRNTRETLVGGHGLPVQQLVDMKPFTMQSDAQLEQFILEKKYEQRKGRELEKILERGTQFSDGTIMEFLKTYNRELGMSMQYFLMRKVKSRLGNLEVLKEYVEGYRSSIPPIKGAVRMMAERVQDIAKVKKLTDISKNLVDIDNSVAYLKSLLTDIDIFPGNIRRSIYATLDRVDEFEKIRKKQPKEGSERYKRLRRLTSYIFERSEFLSSGIGKYVNIRERSLKNEIMVRRKETEKDLDLLAKEIEAILRKKYSEVTERMPQIENGLYKGLALYAYRYNLKELEKKFGHEYASDKEDDIEMNREVWKIMNMQGSIGLVDLCPVFIERHIRTPRYGDFMNICYVPLDVRSHVVIAFPRDKKTLALKIKPGSEYCGVESLEDEHLLNNLALIALGREPKFEVYNKIEERKFYNSTYQSSSQTQSPHIDLIKFISKVKDDETEFRESYSRNPSDSEMLEHFQEELMRLLGVIASENSEEIVYKVSATNRLLIDKEMEEVKVAYLIAKNKMMNVVVEYGTMKQVLDDVTNIYGMLYGPYMQGNLPMTGTGVTDMKIIRDAGDSLDVLFSNESGNGMSSKNIDILYRRVTRGKIESLSRSIASMQPKQHIASSPRIEKPVQIPVIMSVQSPQQKTSQQQKTDQGQQADNRQSPTQPTVVKKPKKPEAFLTKKDRDLLRQLHPYKY